MSYSKGFRFKQSEIGVFSDNADAVVRHLSSSKRIIGLTDGSFSLIDLIHSLLKKFGKSNVIVSTWSAGIKDVNQVRWMLDTDLINDFKIITDHSYCTRQAKYAGEIERLFGKENIRMSESHSKFVLIESEKGEFITVRTSMNLNANRTCENFEIDVCKKIYGFFMSWCDAHFEDLKAGFVAEQRKVLAVSRDFFESSEHKVKDKWWLDV